ncbi:CU044_5270 family protein [Actinoallomurus sp. NPDC052274]|uniref:CU044_5270 family protein n=1 Tax=Actinoallomurus sp. NPDC052274 TaxID=3155420 RepID=UPI0034319CF2
MDDIREVAELLEEGDPSAAVLAMGRRRLDELIRQEPAAAPREVPGGRRRRGRRRLRWALPGLGLVAAGTAAAMALTTTSAPPDRSRPRPMETSQRLSGREVLLAAAASAEAEPATTGRYWHVRRVHMIFAGGPPVGNVIEIWAAKDGWWYEGDATLDGRGLGLIKHKNKDGRSFELVDHTLSFDELQRLPADPRRLTAWALSYARKMNPHWRKKDMEDVATNTLSALLYAVPVSPKVRAAAFRALAQRPDVTSEGRVKDARGRIGQGVTIGGGFHLIIDPKTAFVLQETAGTARSPKRASTLYYEVGWTDTAPHVPGPA